MCDRKISRNPHSLDFCRDFLEADPANRLVLGRNCYAEKIAESIEIGAFIDDFTSEKSYLGKPIVKAREIPENALVVSSLLGRPLTGNRRLREVGVRHLDFFAFYEDSGLDLPPVRFWGGFKQEFRANKNKFAWIESLLVDDESRAVFASLIDFRLSGNLDYMKGFSDREKDQYFEDFLGLATDGEVFVDVGGFDGYTTLEFIRRYPGYRAIYFFEPNPENMATACARLSQYQNVHTFQSGIAATPGVARFFTNGSVSTISDDGDTEISVDRLDEQVDERVSFIKMDIEGAEKEAIEGSSRKIREDHPRLAIAAYHCDDDFWRIPELVLSIRRDYAIYLRHYTEGVAETIMFFVPVR